MVTFRPPFIFKTTRKICCHQSIMHKDNFMWYIKKKKPTKIDWEESLFWPFGVFCVRGRFLNRENTKILEGRPCTVISC